MQVLQLRKEIKIHNIICTADLKQKINIKEFSKYSWGIFDQAIYKGRCGYFKSPDIKGKVTIFSSGKMISLGAKSINEAKEQIDKAKLQLKKDGFIQDKKLEIKIRNIVATFTLKKIYGFERLAGMLPNSIYEPEQFPGIIFRSLRGPVILIFASGKCVMVGGKSLSELNEGLFEVEQMINRFSLKK